MHCVAEYVKLLEQGGGPSLGADGYRGAHAATTAEDNDSLSATVISYGYAECTAAVESKVSNLTEHYKVFTMRY